VLGVMNFFEEVYNDVGLGDYAVELSTRPADSIGTDREWQHSTDALQNAIRRKGMKVVINEGEGAFYGPKIDYHLRDCLKRTHQCGTIQLDFSMPRRFNLEYTGADNKPHMPVMIHRAVFGSLERFIAILLEHYGGDLPLWLAPEQVRVLPISEKFNGYALKIRAELQERQLRAVIDLRSEKVAAKIRDATLMKVPYMLIAGRKEEAGGTVSVRIKSRGDIGTQTVPHFVASISQEAFK